MGPPSWDDQLSSDVRVKLLVDRESLNFHVESVLEPDERGFSPSRLLAALSLELFRSSLAQTRQSPRMSSAWL